MSYWLAAGQISFSHILNNAELLQAQVLEQVLEVAAGRGLKILRPLVVFLLCLATACSTSTPVETSLKQTADTPPQTTSSQSSTLTSPPSVPDPNLARVLNPLLDGDEFSSARWGVAVVSLSDGKVVYERNGDKLFTPASNMKVYTTAVALDLLGSNYRWRTSLYAEAEPDRAGTIRGDLILYGRGAPDLTSDNKKDSTNSLEQLVLTLMQRGVKRVQGNVIGDESYFRGDEVGDGWQWNDLQWYFGAEASALSINDNEVEINITAPRPPNERPAINSSDVDDYVRVTNDVAIAKRGERFTIGIQRGLSDNDVRVWGQFPVGRSGYGVRLSVHRPGLWAARLLLRALKKHGITVDGTAELRDSRMPEAERFKPDDGHELALVVSNPLSQIVKSTNKESINLNAELILRTLGRERAALLSTPESGGRERGDDEAGLGLVRLWLSRVGIASDGIALHDGSGLSRLNLVTPKTTAGLLFAINRTASSAAFKESLPIAGTDGTLRGRLAALGNRVIAKTGSLTYDNSLSGYVTTSKGTTFSFSIMCNDSIGRNSSIKLIDEIVSVLAEYPGKP